MQDHAKGGGLPRPRAWTHPGPVQAQRITRCGAARGRHLRIALPPGASLFDGLVQPLAALGIRNAAINILGGEFEQLVFCVAPPDPTGRVAVAYTDPIDAGRAYLLGANATLGSNEAGQPMVHCHGGLRDAAGQLLGGHLLPQACMVGRQELIAFAVSLEGFAVQVGYDPETMISLFQPVALAGAPDRAESSMEAVQ
ncbi:MAG TPA: DUF296 domain-containing protein [Bordetella sp.]